jgi:polyphosphate kinase
VDLMPRNLDKQIEVIFPIKDEELHKRRMNLLNVIFCDNVNARTHNRKVKYKHISSKSEKLVNRQT